MMVREIPGNDVGLSRDNDVKCHHILVTSPAQSYFLEYDPVAPPHAGRGLNANTFRFIQTIIQTLFNVYFPLH